MKRAINIVIISIAGYCLLIFIWFGILRGAFLGKTFEFPLISTQGIIVDSGNNIFIGIGQGLSRINKYDSKGNFIESQYVETYGNDFYMDFGPNESIITTINRGKYDFNNVKDVIGDSLANILNEEQKLFVKNKSQCEKNGVT